MTNLLVSAACLIIFINSVPRVNDLQITNYGARKWLRLAGLLTTAGSSVWLGIMVLLPGKPHDLAAALLMAGVAVSWSTSPVINCWWTYTFKKGSDKRYESLKRRSSDKGKAV